MRSSISSIVFKCSCLAFIEAQLVNTCCRAGSNLCAPRAIVPRSGIALTVLGEKDLIMKPKTAIRIMPRASKAYLGKEPKNSFCKSLILNGLSNLMNFLI